MRHIGFYVGSCKKLGIMAVAAANLLAAFAILVFTAAAGAVPSGVFPDKYAAIVIDANSGRILFSDRADIRRYPASLTKMMTLYLLFDAMRAGRLSANTFIPISAYANGQPPTKLNLGIGQKIGAEAAAKALITKSANDIAVAIAEYLGGSEKNFARMMNLKARQLGMRNTNFANASGLPNLQNYSTARDLALLALALHRNFPEQYSLFGTTSFVHRGRLIRGHNRLVANMAGVDGIKTGYTRMSGFNLASSRHIGNKSIVAIVMGGKTSALRDSHMAGLLTRYMDKAGGKKGFGILPPAQPDAPVLMATVKETDNRVAAADLAAAIPVPTAKMLAAITSAGADKADIPLARGASGDNAALPVPRPSPAVFMSDRERDSALLMMLASQSADDMRQKAAVKALDNIVTASLPGAGHNRSHKKGWAIQLAASKSPREAEQILREAESGMQKIYASATPYTEKFVKHGIPYYRVRFGGFPSKAAARHSCARLKKSGRQCIAVAG